MLAAAAVEIQWLAWEEWAATRLFISDSFRSPSLSRGGKIALMFTKKIPLEFLQAGFLFSEGLGCRVAWPSQ
jgi:hypothetical protein